MAIRTILFDVYGTLLNVHSIMKHEGRDLGARADAISQLWRQKQLEYTWVWSLRDEYRGFRTLTETALDYALAAHGVTSSDLRARLLRCYESLEPFPDVPAALAALRSEAMKIAALSNGDPDLLEIGLGAAGLRPLLDAVLSVAPLRIYKPDRRVYEMGRVWADLPASEIAFVSANAWDVAGAAAFGFRTFWINRTGQVPEYGIEDTATMIDGLDGLTAALS